MSINTISSSIPQTSLSKIKDPDHDNDQGRPDNDADNVKQNQAQKLQSQIKLEQSVKPNLGQNVNAFA